MVSDKKMLKGSYETEKIEIGIAGNYSVVWDERGARLLCLNETKEIIDLKEVVYAPGFSEDLVYVTKVCDDGYYV